jgi:aldose 1-epimerase
MAAEHVVLQSSDIELTVVPDLGARMHSLSVRGREVLRSPSQAAVHADDPFFWGGFIMAPWCNRLAPGAVEVGDKVVNLPANFRDGSAIHGQVYVAAWQRIGDAAFAIESGGSGWPWRYRVEADYGVSGARVEIVLRLRNLSADAMPAGIGLHPWFPNPVEARINCALTYGANDSPHAAPVPVSGDLDVRSRQQLAKGVDSTWTDLTDPPIELWWPDDELHAAITAPFPTLHVTAANASDLDAIAVEPQTQAPQGLARLINHEPGAMTWIEPGGQLTLPITVEFDWTS